MTYSPVVDCVLKKGLQKGGHWLAKTSLAKPLWVSLEQGSAVCACVHV